MARIDIGDMPGRIEYDLNDIQEYQTSSLLTLLNILQDKGVLTLPEFGKYILSTERNIDKPSEQLMVVLGRALASLDPDPPQLSVVE